MPICKNCEKEFPDKIEYDGEIINLLSRKFCPDCSPIGSNNTRSYIVKLEENQGFCARCKKIKDIKEFYTRKNGKPLSYCAVCQKEVKELKLQENIERIAIERNGACEDCGIIYPIELYEFYSIKSNFNITSAKNMSFERIKEELKDYVMLCKNCCALRKWELG